MRGALAAQIEARPDVETGGILIGAGPADGTLTVAKASAPGPNARHRRYWFSRDTSFAQDWLDREYSRSDGRHDYIGEWHVHPSLHTPPSAVDRREMWKIARSRRNHVDQPVLIIVECAPPAPLVFRAYRFSVKPNRCDELPVDDVDA